MSGTPNPPDPAADPGATPDFRTLFECAPGLYLVLKPSLHIVAASDAYLRATMTVRDAILGRHIFEVFPDNPADPGATGVRNLRASLEEVLRQRRPDTMAVQKYDVRRPESEGGGFEERFWSPVNSPVLAPDGTLVYIIHRVEDVTAFVRLRQAGAEREKTTEALRARAERMETEVFLRARELGEANVRLRAVNVELARLYNQVALLVSEAGDELKLKHGREDQWDFLEKPMPPGEMMARVGRLIDEHKRMEEQLRQSQKMEAIGRLAGGLAHDFNNLLTVITGYAALMRVRMPEDADLSELEEIEQAAVRASSLTTKLLAFSRKQVLQPRILDLNSLISGMEHLLRRLIGEDILLVTALAGGLGRVKADPGQIDQVVMNLVVNARDAMPEGGRLIIETRNVFLATGECPPLAPGDYVMMSVTDTGHGMDERTAARIFEPFFTTKEMGKGTGLGLSTAHGIIEQSGGLITVKSSPGAGAAFQVYLPLAHACTEESCAPLSAPADGRGGTILLVEDEAPLRKLVRTVLTAARYLVLEAADGEEAVSLSMQHEGPIDLLLTDVVMPGVSGPELASRLRRSRPGALTLFMSGYDQSLVDQKALEHASFLPKPFTPTALLSKTAELVGAHPRIGQAARPAR